MSNWSDEPRIMHVSVNWMRGWGNLPRWQVVLTRQPETKEFRFYEPRSNCILGFCGDAAHFNALVPNDHTGYGGAEFTYNTITGKTIVWRGPWSSNSDHINTVWPIFEDHSVECYNPLTMRGFSVKVSALAEYLKLHRDLGLGIALIQYPHGKYYSPLWWGVQKPENQGQIVRTIVNCDKHGRRIS